MATYATKIAELRAQSGDTKRRVHVDWIADGIANTIQMPADTYPVLEDPSTYVVTVNGSTLAETSQYTFDKVTGTITLTTTPTVNQVCTVDSIAVYLRDSDWVQVINDTVLSLGDDFWKEFVETDLTTTAGATEVDLATERPRCIAVYEFQHRLNTSENWKTVEDFANWRFDRENNKIYVGRNDVFTTTGERLRVRGLEGYTLSTTVSDTIDLQDRFMTILEFGALARYWRWRYKHVIELISKMTTESSRTPLQELIMLSDRFDRLFETEKARLKPQKPPRIIPRYLEGGGRP